MQRGLIASFLFILCSISFAQSDLQRLIDSQKALDIMTENKGARAAFLEYLASDGVVFEPQAVNGLEFWRTQAGKSVEQHRRSVTLGDVSSNGLLGYATGTWELNPNGKRDVATRFGQYVTIWEKRAGNRFRAVIEINITHDEITARKSNHVVAADDRRDSNKRGWSVADASMNFQRAAMSKLALSGAYDKFMADDARVLLDGLPPLTGRKAIISEARRYRSVLFPNKVISFQNADMAYMWNPCSYTTSEGIEAGNCLQVWKLRNKKWWIVLGVFAAVRDDTPPVLKSKKE